jgi:opacity protein-like surface antigen
VRTVFQNITNLFLLVACLTGAASGEGEKLKARKLEIEEVRQTLEGISEQLSLLKNRKQSSMVPEAKISSPEPINIFPKRRVEEKYKGQRESPSVQFSTSKSKNDFQGFYLMPFMGLQNTGDLVWKSFFGDIDIKESSGAVLGLSTGWQWRNFFSDFQLSYTENKMKSIEIPVPLSFTGESTGVGVHLAGGGRFFLNDFVSFSLGAGIGGVNQNISFELAGIPVEEKDFLLSYQLFTGLEIRPIESACLGLRYRWLNIEEMESFSSRDLHLLEMYLGYLF